VIQTHSIPRCVAHDVRWSHSVGQQPRVANSHHPIPCRRAKRQTSFLEAHIMRLVGPPLPPPPHMPHMSLGRCASDFLFGLSSWVLSFGRLLYLCGASRSFHQIFLQIIPEDKAQIIHSFFGCCRDNSTPWLLAPLSSQISTLPFPPFLLYHKMTDLQTPVSGT
jgi:hypothetical protein